MNSHHALLFVDVAIEALPIEESYKLPSQDVTHIVVDRFGIDDARTVTQQSFQKPVVFSKRAFVLSVQDITTEAQNALLKLFEEPPETASFFLIVKREGVLLPTLRSRLLLIQNQTTTSTSETSHFLELSLAQQLKQIAVFAKEKDIPAVESLLFTLEQEIARTPQENKQALRAVLFARSYLGTPGASTKMLLEEVALSLPR